MRDEVSRLWNKIDLHIHTDFSDGSCSVRDVVHTAETKGLEFVAVTDHYSEFQNLPKRMRSGQISGYLDALGGSPLLRGVEVEIFSDGTVSISPETSRRFDPVIGGVHNLDDRVFWGDPRPVWDQAKFMKDLSHALIGGMETGLIDVLAHPTWLPEGIRPQTTDLVTEEWIDDIVEAARRCEVAIEVSGAWKVPDEVFVRRCMDCGVKLSIGSDAHNINMIGETSYSIDLLKKTRARAQDLFLPSRTRR